MEEAIKCRVTVRQKSSLITLSRHLFPCTSINKMPDNYGERTPDVCESTHTRGAPVHRDLSRGSPLRRGREDGRRGIEMVRRARRDSLTAGQLQEKLVFVTREHITATDFNGSNKMQVDSAFSVAERTPPLA